MKKYYVFFAIALTTVILLFSNKNKADDNEKIKIGVSVYDKNDTFIASITNEMDKQAKKEIENGAKLKLDISDGKNNQLEQNDKVDKYLELDYDVICVNLVDRTNAASIIDKAIDNKTPVVFFNRQPVEEDLYRNSNIYYLGSNPKLSAIIQGELIVDAYNNKPELIDKNNDGVISYAMIEGEVGHQDTIYRTEYVAKTLNANNVNAEKIVGGVANFDRDQSRALVEQWIKDGIDIELVICNNDDMALGALDAYKKYNLKMPIVGVDGTKEAIQEVNNGNLLGTAVSDYEEYGDKLFEVAYALAKGQPLPADIEVSKGKYIWIPWKGILSPNYQN